jgi:hypothetical protein
MKEPEYVSVRIPRAEVIAPRAFGKTEQDHVNGLLKKGGIDPAKPFSQEEDTKTGDFVYKQDKAILDTSSPAQPPK